MKIITEITAKEIVEDINHLNYGIFNSIDYEIQDDYQYLLIIVRCEEIDENKMIEFHKETRKIIESKIPSFNNGEYTWSVIFQNANGIFDTINPLVN